MYIAFEDEFFERNDIMVEQQLPKSFDDSGGDEFDN